MNTELRFVSTPNLVDEHPTTNGYVTKEEYELSKAWGLSIAIDLHDCDPDLLKNADAIKKYAAKVCAIIDAKPGVHATFSTLELIQMLQAIL